MSRSLANFSASARSSAPDGRSKARSTFAALILERRPCGLSTWKEAGVSPRTAPTFRSPSSSYKSCMPGKLQDAREVPRKALQAVVTTLHDHLLAPRVAADGLAIVEHLVTRQAVRRYAGCEQVVVEGGD